MATEKRLIDANKLQLEPDARGIVNGVLIISRTAGKTMELVQKALKCMIDNAPTVDAVEVVRCKECKKWFTEDPERCKALSASPYGWCCRNKTICDTDHTDITQHDDFCSYGERRLGDA